MRLQAAFLSLAIAVFLSPTDASASFLKDLDKVLNPGSKKSKGSGMSSAQRAENRRVQTALNYFSFPVGTPDGALGRKSKAAIGDYQAYIGSAVTNALNDDDKQFLLNSYDKAVAGGDATKQIALRQPDGNKGLLKYFKNQAQAGTMVPQTPQVEATGGFTGFNTQAQANSIANYCNNITLKTSTNGGYVSLDTMTDPHQALDEQFCLARVFAISKSEEMVQKVLGGTTIEQMEAQCEQLVPMFSQEVSSLSISSLQDVIKDTGNVIVGTGMKPQQLIFSGEICLGIGYRTDNTELSLASALMLSALGKMPYAELMGHHLINGFGTTQRNDLAGQWYDAAVQSVQSGQPAVFAPSNAGRMPLISAASSQLGGSDAASSEADSGTGIFALPGTSD